MLVGLLQLPLGPIELTIYFAAVAIVLSIVGRRIYRDAKARGSNWAWQWAVGIVFLLLAGLGPGVIGVLLYVTVRGDYTKSSRNNER